MLPGVKVGVAVICLRDCCWRQHNASGSESGHGLRSVVTSLDDVTSRSMSVVSGPVWGGGQCTWLRSLMTSKYMGSDVGNQRGCRCGLGAESGIRSEFGRKWVWFGMAEDVLVTLYIHFSCRVLAKRMRRRSKFPVS